MRATIDVDIEILPKDAADAFSNGGDHWQALFFNLLAEDVELNHKNGIAGFVMQMQYIVNTKMLTPSARRIMSIIGEYSSKED